MSENTWMPEKAKQRISEIEGSLPSLEAGSAGKLKEKLDALVQENRHIHESQCINLNPATNSLSPRAELALSEGLSSRTSLGYPGDKYEMGLEAIEEIEVITAYLARKVFRASYAEIRVGSGALANLYAFMATAKAGDSIVAMPASIAGHVTHHLEGAAGLYGLNIVEAEIDPQRYTVDLAALEKTLRLEKPKLVTLGGSLNLCHHPVKEVSELAHKHGAYLLFDGAHLSGLIAGRAWPNPLEQGADLLTMSCYKSLAGPASGLVLTQDETLAKRLDAIAYPGLTANFDAGKTAALAYTLLDWIACGKAYAQQMLRNSIALQKHLLAYGMPLFLTGAKGDASLSKSHAFAIKAGEHGYAGGQAMAKQLRKANILSSGIGLPGKAADKDFNGLRLGTNEITRIGMTEEDMKPLAEFIFLALKENPVRVAHVAHGVTALRKKLKSIHFTLS